MPRGLVADDILLLLVPAGLAAHEHTLPGLKHLLASENTITFSEEIHQPLAVGHNSDTHNAESH